MAVFTNIITDTDLQDVDIHQELQNALNERYYALYGARFFSPLVGIGDDIQSREYWYSMQNLIYTLVGTSYEDVMYISPNLTISGNTSSVLSYAWADFLADANIPNGFRRATSNYPSDWTNYTDAAFSYGFIETGDIIGGWLIVDLQKAIHSLRRLWVGWNQDSIRLVRSATGDDADCSSAYTECENDWNTSDWTSQSVTYSCGIERSGLIDDSGNTVFEARRVKLQPYFGFWLENTSIVYDVNVYAYPTDGWDNGTSDFEAAYGWADSQWNFTGDSETSVTTSSWECPTYFGDGMNGNPMNESVAVSCPITDFSNAYTASIRAVCDITFLYHL